VEQAHAAASLEEVFCVAREAARELNFEYCAYLLSELLPCAQPKVVSINNFPEAWQQWYQVTGVQRTDPTVIHCKRSNQPIVWNEEVFAQAPMMWARAVEHGVRIAWSIGLSTPSTLSARGMFTFARNRPDWTSEELPRHEQLMTLVAKATHEAALRVSQPPVNDQTTSALTYREIEVLRWTGDGKTTSEIAQILSLSENTIKFHVKNAMTKLGASNRTAAVVKAAILGLLH
jgi:LuxR family transcriptional regulator